MRGRLRIALPTARAISGCSKVVPVNGVGRTVCGWLFGSSSGPTDFTIRQQDQGHWEGLSMVLNDDPYGQDYTSNPPYIVKRHSEGRRTIASLFAGVQAGYMQADTRYSHGDAIPAFGFFLPNLTQGVYCDYDPLVGGLGNTAFYLRTYGVGSAGQIMLATNAARLACEIRPSDRSTRGWSDPGGDARVTGGGVTTIVGTLYPLLWAYNGVNGYTGRASYSNVVVTKERAININVPAARSVRVSVDGVVQTFPGPVGYLALPAGVGAYDPLPGIWWPSMVRFEFFSLAALGGVLIADLTYKAWGGDTIGMV